MSDCEKMSKVQVCRHWNTRWEVNYGWRVEEHWDGKGKNTFSNLKCFLSQIMNVIENYLIFKNTFRSFTWQTVSRESGISSTFSHEGKNVAMLFSLAALPRMLHAGCFSSWEPGGEQLADGRIGSSTISIHPHWLVSCREDGRKLWAGARVPKPCQDSKTSINMMLVLFLCAVQAQSSYYQNLQFA